MVESIVMIVALVIPCVIAVVALIIPIIERVIRDKKLYHSYILDCMVSDMVHNKPYNTVYYFKCTKCGKTKKVYTYGYNEFKDRKCCDKCEYKINFLNSDKNT